MAKTKYILSRGSLSRKDNSLCVRSEDNKINYFPIEEVREIYLLNEVSLNSKLLDLLARYGIILHFFNYYGNYSGSYYPKRHYLSGKLLLKQAQTYEENRLRIAQSMVRGIGENMVQVLYHYFRHGKEVKDPLDKIREKIRQSGPWGSKIEHLLYREGFLWEQFYQACSIILPEDFDLGKRTRRPPDNPMNAMISFGNSLLYTKTISAIHQTHMEPTISYLHEPFQRRFSLALDISEAFKPLIVFRTIFDLVNNRKLKILNHFEQDYNCALLNLEGRKLFIAEFERRINGTIRHTRLKRNVSYQTLIKYDCYKLMKDVMEGVDFLPYLEKEKC